MYIKIQLAGKHSSESTTCNYLTTVLKVVFKKTTQLEDVPQQEWNKICFDYTTTT
jgi:hypothetical protein